MQAVPKVVTVSGSDLPLPLRSKHLRDVSEMRKTATEGVEPRSVACSVACTLCGVVA